MSVFNENFSVGKVGRNADEFLYALKAHDKHKDNNISNNS